MRRGGRRQQYITASIFVLLIGCLSVVVLRSTAHRQTPVPDVLGAASGSVDNQAVRTASSDAPAFSPPTNQGLTSLGGQATGPGIVSRQMPRRSVSPPVAPATGTAVIADGSQQTGGHGAGEDTDYKVHPPNESSPEDPAPVGVPTPVATQIVGRRAIEIPLGSVEPWADSFTTSDNTPVLWQPAAGDAAYWEGESVGTPLAPVYLIIKGQPTTPEATLLYKVLVNDVVAQPGDTVTFTLYVPDLDQSVQLQVTITP